MLPSIEQAKASLSRYADSTPPPKRISVPIKQQSLVSHVSQLERVELIKLQAIIRMATTGYELYTADERETVQNTAGNLVELYNTINGSSLWKSASKRGVLRTNCQRYQDYLQEKGPN